MILVGSGLEVAYGDCRRRVECGFPGYVSRHRWLVGTEMKVKYGFVVTSQEVNGDRFINH